MNISEIRGKVLPENWMHCTQEEAVEEIKNDGEVLVKARVFWSNRFFSHHTDSGYEDFFLYRDREGFEWATPGFPMLGQIVPWHHGYIDLEFFRTYEIAE